MLCKRCLFEEVNVKVCDENNSEVYEECNCKLLKLRRAARLFRDSFHETLILQVVVDAETLLRVSCLEGITTIGNVVDEVLSQIERDPKRSKISSMSKGKVLENKSLVSDSCYDGQVLHLSGKNLKVVEIDEVESESYDKNPNPAKESTLCPDLTQPEEDHDSATSAIENTKSDSVFSFKENIEKDIARIIEAITSDTGCFNLENSSFADNSRPDNQRNLQDELLERQEKKFNTREEKDLGAFPYKNEEYFKQRLDSMLENIVSESNFLPSLAKSTNKKAESIRINPSKPPLHFPQKPKNTRAVTTPKIPRRIQSFRTAKECKES